MCKACFTHVIPAAVLAGIALTLAVSAFAHQLANPSLSVDWASTAKNFLKYAVGFFLFGLAKWKAQEGMQAHMKHKKR